MRSFVRCSVVVAGFALLVACGSGVVTDPFPSSPSDAGGPDVTSGPSFVADASLADAADSGTDGGGTIDAPPLADAGPLGMSPCAVDRDVFHLDVTGPSDGIQSGPLLLTNHDSQWQVSNDTGLRVYVNEGPLSAELDANALSKLGPGTYAISNGGPTLGLAIVGDGISMQSGTFTIADLTTDLDDAGNASVRSLSIWFDTSAPGYPGDPPIFARGCVKYAKEEPIADAGGSDGDTDAAIDASPLDACAGGGYVFHVEGDGDGGYAGILGAEEITDAIGTWSADDTSGEIDAIVHTGNGDWQFVAGSTQGISTGTYVSSGDDHFTYAQVVVNGVGCTSVPTGTFTIDKLEGTGSDNNLLSKLRATFDLQCPGQGELRGCVSLGK